MRPYGQEDPKGFANWENIMKQIDDGNDKDDDDELLYEPSVIDLHGFSTGVALEQFVRFYNKEIGNKIGGPITVNHGYGSTGAGGDIRKRLRAFLQEHSDYLWFEIGENIDNNPGITVVYPKRPLPPMADSISGKILEFCTTAKSEEKIFNKFRLYGDTEVKKAIKSLEKQGRIHPKDKGKIKAYETVRS
jgi:hypothetical protein